MVNQAILEGKWNEFRGKIKEKWGELTDDDVRSFTGNVDQLVGRIQQKTGETRQSVERFLEQMTNEGASALNRARETVEQTVKGARETAEQTYSRARETVESAADQVQEGVREGYAQAERMVQERPAQSMFVAFGLGVLTGVGVALLLREQRPSFTSRAASSTEQFGHQVLDALASALPESFSKRFRG